MAMPSKGARRRLNLRLPLAVYVAVAQAAMAADETINDWATRALARAAEESK